MSDLELYFKALSFAAYKHRNQRRKNNEKTPYINHPIQVATLLVESEITDVNVLIAALLHDTIEDTDTTIKELEEQFGPIVTEYVKEVTDDKSLSKLIRKKLQIEHAFHASIGAKLIKLADKYSNLFSILTDPPPIWSEAEKMGYVYWAYAVCKQIKGTNKILEEKLENLFKQFGISDISEKELEEKLEDYYKIIDNLK